MIEIQSPGKADFHVHYSDENAEWILTKAKEANLCAVAFIRRAEMSDSLGEYINFGKSLGVEVIPGVEYFAALDEGNVDLISLGFDVNSPSMREVFGVAEKREYNARLAASQMRLMEDQGFSFQEIPEEEMGNLRKLLDGEVTEKAILVCRLACSSLLNQQKIAELKRNNPAVWERLQSLVAERPGYKKPGAIDAKFLWQLYFAPGKSCFRRVQISAQNLIERTHQAGGVVLYSPEGELDVAAWHKLIEQGIDGIMGWHGSSLEISKSTVREVRAKGLLILGGSDYDMDKDHWQLGIGDGSMFLSLRRLNELKLRLKQDDRERTQE
jgi:hypothetical protein